MSRWVEKRTRSVLPVYFAGAVWLLAGLVLPCTACGRWRPPPW